MSQIETFVAKAAHSEQSPPHVHPKYRPDIDGLRAIAVLSVVIFHAFPSALRGGFTGVDVFFVISGFLISSIIFGNLQNGSFSFLDFYGRRIRRIFPVLLIVLTSSLIAGWFILLADEYKQLGLHISSGAGFVANFALLRESGYFDNAADTKPLLHLWSLGVEEQFYIVWPILLWWAWKKRLNLLSLTLLVGLVSFALNVWTVHSNPAAAFYAPQSRFWEMLAGSVLAYLTLYPIKTFSQTKLRLDTWLGRVIYAEPPPPNGATLRDVQSVLGVFLILAAFSQVSKEYAFPGWWALMPTVGAILLIGAGSNAWVNRKLLSHPLMVWVGLISFPLYLWHWPLLTFARIFERDIPLPHVRMAMLVLAVLLAWLSYTVVEKPIRSGRYNRTKTGALLLLMVTVGTVGYTVYRRDGIESRLRDRQEFLAYFENSVPEWRYFNRIGLPQKVHHECEFYDIESYRAGKSTMVPRPSIAPECYQRDPSKPHVVMLWGDSHAEQLSYGIRKNIPSDWQVLQVTSSACPAYINIPAPSTTDHCLQSNWFAQNLIKDVKPDVVVIAQNLGHTTLRFNQFTETLRNLGVKKIVFTGPDPHWTSGLPQLVATQLWPHTPRRTYRGIDQSVIEANRKLLAEFKPADNVVFVDLIGFFCDKKGCLTYLGDDRMTGLTSYDYGHLTPVASDYLAKNLLVNVITGPQKP